MTVTANGASPSSETYPLPAGTSTRAKPFWTGDAVKGFKYGDPNGENGPVKSGRLKLRNGVFQIKVVVDGKLGPVDVVPPDPGTDGCAVFTILGGDSYSVQFASGHVTNKGTMLFKVAKPTAQGFCVHDYHDHHDQLHDDDHDRVPGHSAAGKRAPALSR